MPIAEPQLGSGNWGAGLNAALTQLDTVGASSGFVSQSISVPGSVTINATSGQHQRVVLSANATSAVINNGSLGQRLTIQWEQDATGGHTYVWPTNCKFAGGSAPSASTAASYSDLLTFVYDGTNWLETAAALAVR
jgi:hypothetical protein